MNNSMTFSPTSSYMDNKSVRRSIEFGEFGNRHSSRVSIQPELKKSSSVFQVELEEEAISVDLLQLYCMSTLDNIIDDVCLFDAKKKHIE